MPNEMNTIQNAWNVICEFEYLVEADHNARKGKRYRPEVLAFTANLEHHLFQIQEQMIAVDCPLGPYRKLWVSVPKKRLVMALPYPDRIVQWALYQYLNPIYDRLFIEDSYGELNSSKVGCKKSETLTAYLYCFKMNRNLSEFL